MTIYLAVVFFPSVAKHSTAPISGRRFFFVPPLSLARQVCLAQGRLHKKNQPRLAEFPHLILFRKVKEKSSFSLRSRLPYKSYFGEVGSLKNLW